ncbi:MAG: bifunctional acetate--CoA ligase family protein/GNAT family N-acetyltransferase [bacterium]
MEPIHNLLGRAPSPLDPIFSPAKVAVIGASEGPGSVGRALMENLAGFPGDLFPVNPKHSQVLGRRAYPRIGEVPQPVDLAVIATPAATVPGIIAECVQAGVRGAIILSAGFRETGPAGAELERKILAEARRNSLRLLGPNCLGLMRPAGGLNATFASRLALPGKVALVSQSGALCTSILDWSLKERVGFSAFVSIGSMLDLGWGDLIDYLSADPETQSILLYMESIGNAAAFLSAAREAALKKPIIVLKAGVSPAAAQAAASHTGALTGSDEVLDAAFQRAGVLRVRRIDELFLMAEVLAKQPRPSGPRLTIVTNAGGPGVLATDALAAAGGQMAELAPETRRALDAFLPPHWSHGNPIDLLGDADPERYGLAVEIALKDSATDGLLVILTPQEMTDPTATAERLLRIEDRREKPLLASWMGGIDIAAGEDHLNRGGIPTFPYPDTAAEVFQYMWDYSRNLRQLYETPALPPGAGTELPDRRAARDILEAARRAGRTLLNEVESKRLLASYGIPTVPTELAADESQAVAIAERLGYPVVLKLFSESVTHKSDVGGVQLNLHDAGAVRQAFQKIAANLRAAKGEGLLQGVSVQAMVSQRGYELILGASTDPQFGPVLLFGTGGELVEVFRDRALALPPLTSTLARSLMERTRIFRALTGVRGRPPVDLPALEGLLVRFSQLIAEQRSIRELDINPLLVSESGMLALDARVLLQDPQLPESAWPATAIRPYPLEYAWSLKLRDGASLRVRPIRPEDEPQVAEFQRNLSRESVFSRYFSAVNVRERTRHERLAELCFIDYARQMVLVAEAPSPAGAPRIVGLSHLIRLPGLQGSEFAILLADDFQRRGLGTELLGRLIAVAQAESWLPITAVMLPENKAMQEICQRLGFRVAFSATEGFYKASFAG